MEKYLKTEDFIVNLARVDCISISEMRINKNGGACWSVEYRGSEDYHELKEFKTEKSARFILDSIAGFLASDERVFSNFELPAFKEGDIFHLGGGEVVTVENVFNLEDKYHYDFSDEITRSESYLLDRMCEKEFEVIEKLPR
ncbi:hypothetical protein LJC53_02935 [Bacteroidales bacterium OttesenSCG-928-C03]|nr:hypothetical protein [Bacteroidales bacterium OttesenSCG-928-C03]MDL2326147.1 hypothetical protein [Bacteroidales bacterium OttesenSCG-928-A14]